MKVKWAYRTRKQVRSFLKFKTKQGAEKWFDGLITIQENLQRFPKLGRIVPEYNNENVREILYCEHRVIYQIDKNAIEIVSIHFGPIPLGDIPET